MSVVAISGPTTTLVLENTTTNNDLYAYIMGSDPNTKAPTFLVSNPVNSVYMATSADAPADGSPINHPINFHIPPMTCIKLKLPYLISGRIYLVYNNTLNFTLNPGPTICQPSGTNPDSNPQSDYNKIWAFCEFTFTAAELYANLSYVDFISLPIAMKLEGGPSTLTQVLGIPEQGLQQIAEGLIAQNNFDHAGWDQLIVKDTNGGAVRIIAPTYCPAFNTYLDNYIKSTWQYYATTSLTIESDSGTYTGQASGTNMVFTGCGAQPMPSTSEVWHSAGGIFNSPVGNVIGAALNRGTLRLDNNQPNGEDIATFYNAVVANHYARVVHAANMDHRGYCHPYDDVTSTHVPDQSGCVRNSSPSSWTVTVGGPFADEYSYNATKRLKSRKKHRAVEWTRGQQPAPSKFKRDTYGENSGSNGMPSPLLLENYAKAPTFKIEPIKPHHTIEVRKEDKKIPDVTVEEVSDDEDRDVEKAEPWDHNDLSTWSGKSRFGIPPSVSQLSREVISKLQGLPIWTSRLQPLFSVINSLFLSLLSVTMRAVLSRVFIFILVALFWMFGGFIPYGQSTLRAEETQRRVLETIVALNQTMSALQV